MSLKDHLEHLVMRLGSRASAPTHWGNRVIISHTGSVTDYVLPSDGYVNARINCREARNNGLQIIAAEAPESATLAVQVQPNSTDPDISVTFLVYGKKGDTARLVVKSGTNDVYWFCFIPSVGGRY